jgi:iron complex transport system substrate-binding protein
MRWRRTARIAIAAALALPVRLAAPAGAGGAAPAHAGDTAPVRAGDTAARRVVSLNPSLTAIALALGAAEQLVGVDDFSAQQEPAVATLPRVGGLYDPSLEAVVALRPDLVVLVPSAEQRDFRARLASLGVPLLALDPTSFDEVLASIRTLGDRLGRAAAARERIAAIERRRDAVARDAAGRPRLRAVLVLQREPLFLVGAGSFIDEMLRVAGAENLAAPLGERYPRASLEWLIAAAPDAILDASAEPDDAKAHWGRWSSLPAVRNGNVIALPPGLVTLPGPWLDRALDTLETTVARAVAATPRTATP